MLDQTQIGQFFQRFDSSTLWELALIVAAAMLLMAVVRRVSPWLAGRLSGRQRLLVLAITPYFRLLIVISAFVMATPLVIEPSFQNMVAILGSVGLALGFALKDYASSLIAGVVAIGEFNYRNGDWIQLGDVYGEVRHIGMRTVEIVTPDDNRVLIPHNVLWNQPVFNANNGDSRMQCIADFYLQPEHDGRQVRKVLYDVTMTSPYLYFGRPVAVVANETPYGTRYRIRAYPVDAVQQFRFVTDLTVRGKSALTSLGISYPSLLPALFDVGN